MNLLILTCQGKYHDHKGSFPRARFINCTLDALTPAISPNVGNSNAKFVVVGDCVRSVPWKKKKEPFEMMDYSLSLWLCLHNCIHWSKLIELYTMELWNYVGWLAGWMDGRKEERKKRCMTLNLREFSAFETLTNRK